MFTSRPPIAKAASRCRADANRGSRMSAQITPGGAPAPAAPKVGPRARPCCWSRDRPSGRDAFPSGSAMHSLEDGSPQVLFDYFAGRIFAKMAPAAQDVLFASAFLPKMTAGMAPQLTADAGRLLTSGLAAAGARATRARRHVHGADLCPAAAPAARVVGAARHAVPQPAARPHRTTQPAQVLAVYRRCRQALAAGLGLSPSAATEALYRSLSPRAR